MPWWSTMSTQKCPHISSSAYFSTVLMSFSGKPHGLPRLKGSFSISGTLWREMSLTTSTSGGLRSTTASGCSIQHKSGVDKTVVRLRKPRGTTWDLRHERTSENTNRGDPNRRRLRSRNLGRRWRPAHMVAQVLFNCCSRRSRRVYCMGSLLLADRNISKA